MPLSIHQKIPKKPEKKKKKKKNLICKESGMP
jgi:hypothetical protein